MTGEKQDRDVAQIKVGVSVMTIEPISPAPKSVHKGDSTRQQRFRQPHLPYLALFLMGLALLSLGVILPLRSLYFYQAFPDSLLEQWLLAPTHLLFPHTPLVSARHPLDMLALRHTPFNWINVLLFWSNLVIVCALYLFAIVYVAKHISYRFIIGSTALLGGIILLYPCLTSQDIFSYITYARIGVIYHHNPLTTLPTVIARDPIYQYIFWTTQPSAYGPTWIALTSLLQWLVQQTALNSVAIMVLLLRLLGLAMQLGATALLWQISGALLSPQEQNASTVRRIRLTATLALAWNPLLLLEACMNGHNDATILVLLLCSCWLLTRWQQNRQQPLWLCGATICLALAACLKITFIVLFAALPLFLLAQQTYTLRKRLMLAASASIIYAGCIVILYLPFWHQGAVLRILQVNPSASMARNTPYEFFVRLYASIRGIVLMSLNPNIGSPTEIAAHSIATGLFCLVYLALCVLTLRRLRVMQSLPALIRWMALAWFLFCCVGSTWFWPWYLVSFIGLSLLALVSDPRDRQLLCSWPGALTIALTALSMLSTYVGYTWGIDQPHLAGLPLNWLRGLWTWAFLAAAIPLARVHLRRRRHEEAGLKPLELSTPLSGRGGRGKVPVS